MTRTSTPLLPAEPTDLAAYDYDLPPGAVAQVPAPERDASRLLVLSRETGAVAHHVFRDLPDLLDPGDLVVFNRSRVFPARLLGRRRDGGAAEVFLVRPLGGAEWEALVRPGRRLRPGDAVEIGDSIRIDILALSADLEGGRRVRIVGPTGGDDTEALIERHGHVPLPPYIRRPDRADDRARYQTVYAREPGSVAAPTAGLHFTPALLERLHEGGVRTAELVLHVGPGTFRPVTVDDVSRHRLAPEPYLLPQETAHAVAETRARGGRVVAVGTTTVRVLETRARPGGLVDPGEGETGLVLAPGAPFRVVDALVTNFHLPRSSLLLLVCAFAGRKRVLDAYRLALAAGYRFYSYGDAMLVRGPKVPTE